jgi:hypothetical protein
MNKTTIHLLNAFFDIEQPSALEVKAVPLTALPFYLSMN